MTPLTLVPKDAKAVRGHTCDVCGKFGPWSAEWAWYGSLFDEEDGPMGVLTTCSDECRAKVSHEGGPLKALARKRRRNGLGSARRTR